MNVHASTIAAFFRVGMTICLSILRFAPAEGAPIHFRGQGAELTISELSERMIEIVLTPIDQASGKARSAPPSSVLVEQKRQVLWSSRQLDKAEEIAVGKLRVEIAPEPLTVTIRGADRKIIQQLTFGVHDDDSMTFRADAPVLGMGEGAQQLDRRGAAYTMKDGWGAWERPTFGSWVAVPFLIGTDGWAMFVQHPLGQFDLRESTATFTPWSDQSDCPLVVYLIAWDSPADVLAESARLFGHTPMPPKWALGYMQSHRTLAGPDEVLQVAREFRQRKLPCDALIYLGTGYCPAGWNTGHASVDFNPQTFDKPAEMIDQLHGMNFKIVLHQNAPPRQLTGMKIVRSDAPRAVEKTLANAPTSTISDYWARHRQTFLLGVDGWWPDDGDELDRESRLARHRMYFEGPLLDRPNVRPWNLQRTGYAGAQRYGGWIWSGDVDSRWRTLAAQVAVGQNHSLSLSPYWGSDVGGFYPSDELTGELYVRWFQFGTFCPSFRAHGRTWHLRLPWGWNTGEFGPLEHAENPDPNELHNAQVEPICRKYLELRYRLLPYNYTLCREAHDSGLPLMRALWLHYPHDPHAVARGDEYLWGRDLLVAPVTAPGATERTLYLPEGPWYDFWTNDLHAGGSEITRQVDLATLPLFVRAGAILPLDPVRQCTGESTNEPTTVRVYTGRDGEFRWYDDDGASLDYLSGEFTWIRLNWDDGQRRLTIEPDGDGRIATTPHDLVIELVPSGERKSLRYDGRPVEIAFLSPLPPQIHAAAAPATDNGQVRAVPPELRKSLKLDPFYAKFADANRLPVLSSAKVSDAGLVEAVYLIKQMLSKRDDIRQAMIERKVRFVVMAPDEMTTDVPEQRGMKPKDYWDRRARGLGGRVCSCGEENLLNLEGDRYRTENILIHEFSHTIHNFGLHTVDPTFDDRLKKTYEQALADGRWKKTYAATNYEEYWAEGVQDYFDCNSNAPCDGVHNDVDTREELRAYDPELFSLIDGVFRQTPWRYVRYDRRNKSAERPATEHPSATSNAAP